MKKTEEKRHGKMKETATKKLYKCEDGFIGTLDEIQEHFKLFDVTTVSVKNRINRYDIPVVETGKRLTRAIFEVLEGDDVIFEGDQDEVAEKFDAKPGSICVMALKHNKFKNKYYLRRTNKTHTVDVLTNAWTGTKQMYYDYAIKCLKKYGNTAVSNHGKQIIARLKSEGWKLNVRQVKDERWWILTDLN